MPTIRGMRPGELEDCAALYERVVRRTFTWFDDLGDQRAKFLREAKEEEVYVALSDDQLVGLAAFYRPDSFLHSLYIDYDAHGQGVGTALMAHIEAVSEADPCRSRSRRATCPLDGSMNAKASRSSRKVAIPTCRSGCG